MKLWHTHAHAQHTIAHTHTHSAAGCSPFAVSILADYYPPEFRGTSVGFYYWGIYIGYSLSFAIGDGIKKVLDWRWVFYLSGIIGELCAGFSNLYVRPTL